MEPNDKQTKAIKKRNVQGKEIGQGIFDPDELVTFKERFPNIEFAGKLGDLYHCDSVIDHIKEVKLTKYQDLQDF